MLRVQREALLGVVEPAHLGLRREDHRVHDERPRELFGRVDAGAGVLRTVELLQLAQRCRALGAGRRAAAPGARAARALPADLTAADRARLVEARAVLSEAEINANAAEKLSTDGFASQTRVAQTKAAVEGAKAQITSAEAALNPSRP